MNSSEIGFLAYNVSVNMHPIFQTPFLEDTRNYPTASVPAHISKHTTFRDDPDRDTGSLEKKEDTVKNTKKTESPELRRMPISPETAVSLAPYEIKSLVKSTISFLFQRDC